jgi:hypothetical protein
VTSTTTQIRRQTTRLSGECLKRRQEVADAHDATIYQIALAWLLEHSDVTLPIPGTASLEHLKENVAASSISLSNEEYSRLAEIASNSQ